MENISSPESITAIIENPNEADDVQESNQNTTKCDATEQAPVNPEKESFSSEKSEDFQETDKICVKNATDQQRTDLESSQSLANNFLLAHDQGDCCPTEETSEFQRIPKINCPEKIVFCIDLSTDMTDVPFKIGNSAFYPLVVVKRAIEMFLYSKTRIDGKHEYAFVSFTETAKWVKDFTNDPLEAIQTLDHMNDVKICAECPLASILSLLDAVTSDILSFSESKVIPPPFILRVILIYGRSRCVPKIKENLNALKKLKSSPYFFIDILYLHEPPSIDNKCQEICDTLSLLDSNLVSYMYEIERDVSKLHNCVAKLLAHPLQRPSQENSYCNLRTV